MGVLLVLTAANTMGSDYPVGRRHLRKQQAANPERTAPGGRPVYPGYLRGAAIPQHYTPYRTQPSVVPPAVTQTNRLTQGGGIVQGNQTLPSNSPREKGSRREHGKKDDTAASGKTKARASQKEGGQGNARTQGGKAGPETQANQGSRASNINNRPKPAPAEIEDVAPREQMPLQPASAPPVIAAPTQSPVLHAVQAPSQAPHVSAAVSDLSQEERTRFESAHNAALRDPGLAASREKYMEARREYREKLRAGILRADPNVQPILEKVRRPQRDKH